jgi:hypothetical protein
MMYAATPPVTGATHVKVTVLPNALAARFIGAPTVAAEVTTDA